MTTVLILGATGSVGEAITRNLAARSGYQLRALHRNPAEAAKKLADLPNIDWRAGDLQNPGDAEAAAAGCDVIVHAVNPPGYHSWRELALPMLDQALAAAKANHATLVFPANVYNFAPDIGHQVSENAPQLATTEKGQVRIEMEAKLKQAAADGVQVILVRAGDFFGPGSGSSVLNFLVKAGKPVKKMSYLGPTDVKHAFAYLPDLGDTFGQLIGRRADLPAYADYHFAGHALTGAQLAQAIADASGATRISIGGFPWWLVYLMAPFNPTFRGLVEMRYLWNKPLTMSNAKLVAALGQEPQTPLTDALTNTLAALGSLPKQPAQAMA